MARRYRAKFRSRKRRFRSFGKSRKSFRKRVIRAVRKESEKKIAFNTTQGASITDTWEKFDFTSLPGVGPAKFQRIGNNIFIRYCVARFEILNNGSENKLIRWLCVMPRTFGLTNADLPASLTAFVDIEKFHIIADQTFKIGDATNNPAVPEVLGIKKSMKIMRHAKYNYDNVPAIEGQVWFAWLAQDAIVPHPSMNVSYMMTWNDI